MVPLLSTSKADSGLASEFRWDRAIYTAYERMLKVEGESMGHEGEEGNAAANNAMQQQQAEDADKENGRNK